MPGYTFSQHAQPETVGHTYTTWATVLAGEFEHFKQARVRINTSPAIFVGTEFLLNRERVGEFLGFDSVRVNAHDAIPPFHDLPETLTQ